MKENIDCWIFIGGEHPRQKDLEQFRPPSLIIAADSGFAAALKAGCTPDYVVGDFDSMDLSFVKEKIPPERIHQSPRDKDFSDTELALQLAQRLGAGSPLLIGGGGGRMDHMLAIVHIFNQDYIPAYWISAYERIFLIEGRAILDEKKGRTISFYPLEKAPKQVHSQGLVWELDKVAWKNGEFSLSNRIKSSPVQIECSEGKILAMIPHEEIV